MANKINGILKTIYSINEHKQIKKIENPRLK